MYRSRVRNTAALLACGGMALAFATTTESTDPDRPQDISDAAWEDVQNEAARGAYDTGALATEVAFQERATVTITAIAERHVESFAMSEFREDNTAVLYFSGDVPTDVTEELATEPDISAQGHAEYDSYTADGVNAAVHYALDEQLETEADILTILDPVSGNISVEVSTEEAASEIRSILEAEALELDSEVLRQASADNLNSTVDAAAINDAITVEVDGSLDVVEEAVNGGDKLTLVNSTESWCTAAFPARVNLSAGLTTARHCTDTRALTVDYGDRLFNPPERVLPTANGDASFLLSREAVNGRFRYDWGVYRPVWAHPVLSIGSHVCRFGATTGQGSGCTTVWYISVCANGYCQVTLSLDHTGSASGDSGGPWFYGNNAYGIHHGTVVRDGNRTNVFTRTQRAFPLMGLTPIIDRS